MLDRPICLWVSLSLLHLLLFARSLRLRSAKHDAGLTALGCLLTMCSFASAVQVLVATLLRALPKLRLQPRTAFWISLEAVPGGLIALWYAHLGNRQALDVTTPAQFLDYWLAALAHGGWGLGEALIFSNFAGRHNYGDHANGIVPFAMATLVLLVVPFFSRQATLRKMHLYCLSLILLAVPTTVLSWKFANSIQPRYFYFLYPSLGVLHVLTVLTIAELASRSKIFVGKHSLAFGLVLGAWILAQAAYRVPGIASDWRARSELPVNYPLYVENPSPLCPETLGEFRAGMKGAIDISRVQSRCLLGIDPPREKSTFMDGFTPSTSRVKKIDTPSN